MLFSKDIESLHDDGFDGSVNEHQIFADVFFGNESGAKRCLVTGAINFECDFTSQTDEPGRLLGEDSALTLQHDSYDRKEDFRELSCEIKELTSSTPCVGKVSDPLTSLDRVVADTFQRRPFCPSHSVVCHIVESSNQGIISSCYLQKRHDVLGKGHVLGERDSSKRGPSNIDGNDWKDVAGKAIASPASQESYVNKFLAGSAPVSVAKQSGILRPAKPKWKDSCFVELDEAELTMIRDSPNDPRPLLRYQIHRLLRAAGWVIGRRKRNNKFHGIGEYVYKSPEGRPIREFWRAWTMCGERLFTYSHGVLLEKDCRLWSDMKQFWSDFSDAVMEIEEKMDILETASALTRMWCLLDPFASVVFIDKTLRFLKEGKTVEAKRTLVATSCVKTDAALKLKNADTGGSQFAEETLKFQPCSSSLVSDSALTSLEGDQWIYKECGDESSLNLIESEMGEGNFQDVVSSYYPDERSMCLMGNVSKSVNEYRKVLGNGIDSLDLAPLPACGSESTSEHAVSGLFEVPISSGDAPILLGRCDNVQQDNNKSFPSCDVKSSALVDDLSFKIGSMYKEPVGFDSDHGNNGLMVIKSLTRNTDGLPHTTSSTLKRKAPKKSKKLSEMKLTTAYQDDKLAPSCRNSGLHEVNGYDLQIDSKAKEYLLENMGSARGHQGLSCCSESPVNTTRSKFKKFRQASASSKQLCVFNENTMGVSSGNTDYDNPLPGNTELKAMTSQKKSGSKKFKACRLKDDDLLISAIIKKKASTAGKKRYSAKTKPLRKRKSQKSSCRLLLRSLNKGGKHITEGKWPTFASRTVLSWLIHSGVVSPSEVIQYRNPKDDSVVKDGFITRDGILCKCCDRLLTVSEFKRHAGFKLNRPCLNLFMESGKPFTLCQLEAWSDEYKARRVVPRTVHVEERDQNDDSCGRCGDGGELICCDSCPSTFHQACLFTQELPEGSWYCPHCTCRICGDVVNDNEASASPDGLKCSQCEHKYHEACTKQRVTKSGAASNMWFCSESCQEVYAGLHSCIGLINLLAGGFSWTLLRCIHGDHIVHSAQRFVALKAECNSKLAVAITIMEECFLPMVDPRTGVDMIPHVIYNWGSQFVRLNYHGFYTVILEKDDIAIAVASIRIHGVTVAEMPLIATCSKYRRQGMCRRLMSSIEEMLKSFKVEKLVISAIPSLVETWTVGFGFEPLDDCEKRTLNHINLMVFPGTVWLKKPLFQADEADQPSVHPAETVSCHETSRTTEPMQLDESSLQGNDAATDVRPPPQQFSEDQGGSNRGGQFPATSSNEPVLWSVYNKTELARGSETQEPGYCCEENTSLRYSKLENEIRDPNSNNLQLEEVHDVGGTVRGEDSKLSSEELPIATNHSHIEVDCRVDTLQMNEGSQFCLDEVSQRISVLQGNEM